MPKSFEFTGKKGVCTHFFNMAKNLDLVGLYPEPKYNEADYMPGEGRAQFWNAMERK
jgi:hypothetical protein